MWTRIQGKKTSGGELDIGINNTRNQQRYQRKMKSWQKVSEDDGGIMIMQNEAK
jgi:hypothetical protein